MTIENQKSLLRTSTYGSTNPEQYSLHVATAGEREAIYQARHAVYAAELGQHQPNGAGRLTDSLDGRNVYLVATTTDGMAGFISITAPGIGAYSFDKYFPRNALPFTVDEGLFEVRLLTVLKPYRGSELAGILMYAAFRWVEAHGGRQIVAIGRREIVEMYLRSGLRATGLSTQSGAVTYDLLYARVTEIRSVLQSFRGLLARLESKSDWRLPMPFRQPAPCFHGGAFFGAVGERFDSLHHRHGIINADVLDAWFPPSPRVVAAVQEHLAWFLQTSPPTGCEGLIATLAEARGLKPGQILPGAGSSDLIFRCFRQWLTPNSTALILDPTYGEYAHVLERVIGCTVDRLTLDRRDNYDVNLDWLRTALADSYDLVVLVNPNSPTGRFIPAGELEAVLRAAPAHTRIWIDETYLEYVGKDQSLEHLAARSENVLVCKSMSKAYALSGARVAYLCAGEAQLETLRAFTPPWVISLLGQVAAVAALNDESYYQARYAETHRLRGALTTDLSSLGWDVIEGRANFLLAHLPEDGPSATLLVEACRKHGLFLRDASPMGTRLGTRAVRLAVKDADTNARMIAILRAVFAEIVRKHLHSNDDQTIFDCPPPRMSRRGSRDSQGPGA